MAIGESRGRTEKRSRASEDRPIREDIIGAAIHLFSKKGYDGTSMQDLADAIGIRKASLYHHVRKKEDLLFAIHQQLIDELIARTLEVVTGAESPATKIRKVLRVAMHFVGTHREEVTVFLQDRRVVNPDRWEAIVAKRDMYEQLVAGLIREGIANSDFIEINPVIATRGVLAMSNWGYTWFNPEGELSADEVADIFADMVLRGIEKK